MTADDPRLCILVIHIAKGEHKNFVTGQLQILLVDLHIIGDAAGVGLVTVNHHSDSHIIMLKH